MVAVSSCFASVVLLAGGTAGFRISKGKGNSQLIARVPVLSNTEAAHGGVDGWNLQVTDVEMLDEGAALSVAREDQESQRDFAGQLDAGDLHDHPLHGKTYTLFVDGWDGGSLNKWVGFHDLDQEWMYANRRQGKAMPTHFIRYPAYPNTYILRNDWDGMQKYVCQGDRLQGSDWMRAGCDDRESATPVEFKRQSNGQYKLFNRKRGYYKYISYRQIDGRLRSRYDSDEAMRVSLTEEVNLLAPHTVTICYEAILSVAGGSAGNATYWLQHKHGKTQTKEYTNEIIAETSLGIDLDFPFLEFLGSPSVTSGLKALAKQTSSLTTTSMIDEGYNVTVDISKPCYIYSAEVRTTYKNAGVVVQKSANRHQILPAPLSVSCVTHEM